MKYQEPYKNLTHDGAAICERLDKLIEQQDAIAMMLSDFVTVWRENQNYPRGVTIMGERK